MVGSTTDYSVADRTTPSAPLMKLRAILLMAQPPLLGQGGDWLVLQRWAVVNRAMVRQVCYYPCWGTLNRYDRLRGSSAILITFIRGDVLLKTKRPGLLSGPFLGSKSY